MDVTQSMTMGAESAQRAAATRSDSPATNQPSVDQSPNLLSRVRPRYARAVARQALRHDPDYARFGHNSSLTQSDGMVDYIFASPLDACAPDLAFERLRWGGQFIFISPDRREVSDLSRKFNEQAGYTIDVEPQSLNIGLFGLPIPWLGSRVWYFIARKTSLIPPDQTTDRFTFDVRLVRKRPPAKGYAVLKQVPTCASILRRLRDRNPDVPVGVLERRAQKLVDHVFPVFLTRETAFLQLLQRDLPERFRDRVPYVIDYEKGPDGLVRKLSMNWLRMGGPMLTQIDFAIQAADILRALHDKVKLIHLDLRLDNFVITEKGVGFVDFGSAVRIGEDLSESPMLQSLFDEMMSTSQIQQVLGRMKKSGMVTSRMLRDAHQKIDKAADVFYLAFQMKRPHHNPDFRDLIEYDPESEQAQRISQLTETILRPKNPSRPAFITANDVYNGLRRIKRKLNGHNVDPDADQ